MNELKDYGERPVGQAAARSPARHYQWLLFDADGTLFDYERAEPAAFRQAFERLGISFQPDFLVTYRGINQALWQSVEKGELSPSVVKLRRFEQLLEVIKVSCSATDFSGHYLQCLAACSQLIEDAETVIQALAGRYRLAILTNGLKEVQRGRLELSTIRPHISEIVISEEIGFAKPAPEYFEVALRRLGNPGKHDVLMIGDGWNSDIEGAVSYGIDACWYNPSRMPRPSASPITREIASLRELRDWLA